MSDNAGPIVIDTARHRRTWKVRKWSTRDFETLVHKNADAIVVLNNDGYILYANPAAESLLNLSLAELIGVYFGFPIILNEPVQLHVLREFKDLIAAEMRMVEVTWAGQPCYLLSFRDLTDRIIAGQAINKSRDRLEELVEERARELSEANEQMKRKIAVMEQSMATLDTSIERLASLALSVHNAVLMMPIAVKSRYSPGVLIENGEFIISARECQFLDCMFDGDRTRQIYINDGKYMGTAMFASAIVDYRGLPTAAIGIIDTKGMLSLERFVADWESINRQLGSQHSEDTHLIRSRR